MRRSWVVGMVGLVFVGGCNAQGFEDVAQQLAKSARYSESDLAPALREAAGGASEVPSEAMAGLSDDVSKKILDSASDVAERACTAFDVSRPFTLDTDADRLLTEMNSRAKESPDLKEGIEYACKVRQALSSL